MNPHLVVQSHVSYRLDHPGVFSDMAPPTGIEPAWYCSTDRRPHQRASRARRTSVVMVRRGGFAPPQPLATGLRPAGLACARAGASRHHARDVLACHAYSVFKVRSRIRRAKEKGPGVARPLVGSLLNRGSSSCSHRGDSGPGDARVGSYPRTDVLAGYIGAGRRPQPAFRLRVPNPSLFCL